MEDFLKQFVSITEHATLHNVKARLAEEEFRKMYAPNTASPKQEELQDNELVPVGHCDECGTAIYNKDKSLYIDGWRLCSACVNKMTGKEMLDFLLIEMTEASDEDEE